MSIAENEPTRATKAVRRWFRICSVLFVTCVVLGVALFGVVRADRANRNIEGTCAVWHDVAELPLSANSTQFALQLLADSRIQYHNLDCASKYGDLPAPDPRVQQILDLLGFH